MTGNEFIWCALGFVIATVFTYLLFRRVKATGLSRYLILVPGFIVANSISLILSESPANGLTDQSIIYGYPISFFQLSAWTGYELQPLLCLLNLGLLLLFSFVLVKKLQLI